MRGRSLPSQRQVLAVGGWTFYAHEEQHAPTQITPASNNSLGAIACLAAWIFFPTLRPDSPPPRPPQYVTICFMLWPTLFSSPRTMSSFVGFLWASLLARCLQVGFRLRSHVVTGRNRCIVVECGLLEDKGDECVLFYLRLAFLAALHPT